MKAKQFIYDVKRLFWHPLIILLILLSSSSVIAQIDYHYDQINEISTKDSIVKINWILSSPKKASLTFSQKVFFTNKGQDDLIGSNVVVYLCHNHKKNIDTVRQYSLNTADHMNSNFIVLDLDNAIKLKKKDKVYFTFHLKAKHMNESYVFTIKSVDDTDFEIQKKLEKQAITAIKPAEKTPQPIKYKNLSSNRKFRKLQRQPIGREY